MITELTDLFQPQFNSVQLYRTAVRQTAIIAAVGEQVLFIFVLSMLQYQQVQNIIQETVNLECFDIHWMQHHLKIIVVNWCEL